MKNNTSFLIVSAIAFAAMVLSVGSVAAFNPSADQSAPSIAQVADAAPAPTAEVTTRIE